MPLSSRRNPIKKSAPNPKVQKLRRLVEKSLDSDKALDIAVIDLSGKSSLADYMVVASGTSQKHISTLADHLVDKLQDIGYGRVPVEGSGASDWVVLDAGTIIVHLFKPEMRQLYNLEKMWGVPEVSMEAAL